ncbi:MAG: carbon storage regulator CsrA [bacterium]|nr:carbon storage regulator CsrA [bacterium]
MLVITRKVGEEIVLDGEVRIVIKEVKGKQVRIGVDAPPTVAVHRGEIYSQVAEANARAAVNDISRALEAAKHLRIRFTEDGH